MFILQVHIQMEYMHRLFDKHVTLYIYEDIAYLPLIL